MTHGMPSLEVSAGVFDLENAVVAIELGTLHLVGFLSRMRKHPSCSLKRRNSRKLQCGQGIELSTLDDMIDSMLGFPSVLKIQDSLSRSGPENAV